jgi:hypothetical protein
VFDSHNTTLISVFLKRYHKWCRQNSLLDNKSNIEISFAPNGIPCFRSYEVEKINLCEHPLVAIDSLKEGLHEIDYFNQYRKDHHYIIFSGCWWDSACHHLDMSYTLIFSNFLLYEIIGHYLNPDSDYFYQFQNYNFDYPKRFSFVGVHGTPRQHRIMFHNKLLDQITHDKFILKLDGNDHGQNSSEFDFIQKLPDTSLQEIFVKKFGHYDQGHKAQWLSYAHKLYDQACFQIVLETDFYNENQFFLTEKTIKPLMSGQPFVVCATTGFLSNLHTLGFRTYSELWNEDYDSIINHQDRLQALITLCIELDKFDWSGHRQQLIDIANHNRSQFFNLAKQSNLEFINFEKTMKTLI